MAHALADDLFVGFDVSDYDKPFLLDVLAAPGTPWEEKLAVYDLCLFSGFEDWHLMLECAASIRERSPAASNLDARDVLAFVPRANEATLADEKLRKGWAATDQSIKNLAALLRAHRSGIIAEQPVVRGVERIIKREGVSKREREDDAVEAEPRQRVKRQRTAPKPSTSHYFAHSADEQAPQQSASPAASSVQTSTSAIVRNGIATPRSTPRKRSVENEALRRPADSEGSPGRHAILAKPPQQLTSDDPIRITVPGGFETNQIRGLEDTSPKRKTTVKSPFFNQPQIKQSPKKWIAGVVSTIPFPTLSAPQFGLIQEEFAHEPFWLLVVVTFLVKTAGTLAIPTFRKIKERFPSPTALADPEATATITSMIHHLGLSVVRTAAIQRYARLWLEKPPMAGKTYRVKNYDRRDVQPLTFRSQDLDEDANEDATVGPAGEAEDSWEMGHFTQGKYALDSWRIFCRDELLGRAQDWNGKGAASNFQPEWMRVRPDDKELRACLRWMWMREGWEWNPATGEKTVLREEMRTAVDQGRVEYDETGGIRILDEPHLGLT
ncbi:methyl-CpG binding domain-containing protein 4 [Colletotrichum truncatum]|uniref:Methyl-CpG binding domain-containing protein 4 n=1 Tax=Colletotrichum truncatum TaxID=5467 RepID=A0ACC3Z565_COLTU